MLVLVAQLCLTLWDPMDCSPTGSSIHGIFQARILEWVAIPFSRGSSQLSHRTQVSCIIGRFFMVWATREASGIKSSWFSSIIFPGDDCYSLLIHLPSSILHTTETALFQICKSENLLFSFLSPSMASINLNYFSFTIDFFSLKWFIFFTYCSKVSERTSKCEQVKVTIINYNVHLDIAIWFGVYCKWSPQKINCYFSVLGLTIHMPPITGKLSACLPQGNERQILRSYFEGCKISWKKLW